MGTTPARSCGKHAAPRSGALPSLAVASGRARHGRPPVQGVSSALLGVTAGGLALVAVLPAVVSVPGAGGMSAASAATVQASAPALTTGVAVPAVGNESTEWSDATARASRSLRRVLPAGVPVGGGVAPATVATTAPVRPVLAGCTAEAVGTDDYRNGRLPSSVLCDLRDGSGERLRADAARSFTAMAAAYREVFGHTPCVIDGYRTLGEQQTLRVTKRRFAATPGLSEHGWGLAVDLGCGVQSSGTATHAWLKAHAAAYGWVHPDWAEPGGSRPEPWHWEYVPTA